MPGTPTPPRIVQKFHWGTFALGLAMTVALFTIFVLNPNSLLLIDLRTVDLRLNARPRRPPSPNVVIVQIDDASIAKLGRWPWSRAVMAKLQDAFIDYQVKVIGYDLILSEADSSDVEHETIAARLRAAGLPED